MITTKITSKVLCVTISVLFGFPIFAADEEYNNDSHQVSIYDGWEIVDYSNISNSSIDNSEDFELKAKAFGNTVLNLLGGAAITVCDFGIQVIENSIQRNANKFDAAVGVGSVIVGNLYGQGLAINNAYENEKKLLKEKQG